ncbi:DMT family transporter [Muricoccus radiodurans]|uniref:DMT family transporter n=1 Tax=Muricoccus radiodurans TaxID=2231721 RepID=UPI003CFAB4B8
MTLGDLRFLALGVLLFGFAWPVTKDALRDATPVWFGTGRAGFAALTVAAVLLALRRLRWPGRADWPAVIAVGTMQLGIFFGLTHVAIGYLPAGRTAILSNVTIMWLVPLSVLFLGERVSPTRWAAAGLGLLGALVLVGPWALDWSRREIVVAHLLLMAAALSWSFAILATRRFPPGRPMLELMPFCFGIATLLLLPLALIREPAGGIGPSAWPHMAFIGLIAAPLGTWGVIEAGRRLPSTVASVGFLIAPVLGVAAGALWLGETIGWDVWTGGALVLGSVILAVRG